MNKKEAISYAQVTLSHMQSSKYTGKLNPETFGIEMKQTFRTYPRNIIFSIAEAQINASKKLEEAKNGSDVNE